MLIPQQLTVGVGAPREPKMTRWVAVMAQHPDEGEKVVRFPEAYFDWLEDQVFSFRIFLMPGWIFEVTWTWFFHRENNGTTEVYSLFTVVFIYVFVF